MVTRRFTIGPARDVDSAGYLNAKTATPPSDEDIWQSLFTSDPALEPLFTKLGRPPSWKRPANLSTLVRIILEQQVSLASAEASFKRLRMLCNGKISGIRLLGIDSVKMRDCGISRQKSRYIHALADDVATRRFSVARLSSLTDSQARQAITARLGLGPWSANIYLMMALQRPDILPVGDLALMKGMCELDGGFYETDNEIIERAEAWRPYRSFAVRLIWSLYLHNRNRGYPVG